MASNQAFFAHLIRQFSSAFEFWALLDGDRWRQVAQLPHFRNFQSFPDICRDLQICQFIASPLMIALYYALGLRHLRPHLLQVLIDFLSHPEIRINNRVIPRKFKAPILRFIACCSSDPKAGKMLRLILREACAP
jgi:hypothetical protein